MKLSEVTYTNAVKLSGILAAAPTTHAFGTGDKAGTLCGIKIAIRGKNNRTQKLDATVFDSDAINFLMTEAHEGDFIELVGHIKKGGAPSFKISVTVDELYIDHIETEAPVEKPKAFKKVKYGLRSGSTASASADDLEGDPFK